MLLLSKWSWSTEAMKHVVKFGLVVALLAVPAARAQKPASSEEGKTIFVSRCAKCHDADANRKLPDGTTLLQRLSNSQDRRAALATRLKNQQERDSVLLYLQPLIDRPHSLSQGEQNLRSRAQPPQR